MLLEVHGWENVFSMGVLTALRKIHVIFISSRSECPGSFCYQLQAVSVHWEHLGYRSTAAGTTQEHPHVGKGPSVTVFVQLPVSHLM